MHAPSPTGPIFSAPAPTWRDATWIGEVRLEGGDTDLVDTPDMRLTGSEGYRRARFLVRGHDRLFGTVTVPVREGVVEGPELGRKVAEVRRRAGEDTAPPLRPPEPAFTVVLCTRDRAGAFETALKSVLAQDYPSFEVVVVDNAPATDATQWVVAEVGDPRVRVITEPRPGLSNARNAGVAEARTEWVAFTDDDVYADPTWLRGLTHGMARGGPDCVCVTGFVPTGELRTPAQAWFDSRIGWNRVFRPRIFLLASPPPDLPMFPFQVGSFGAGANFAVRRDVVLSLGGFDPYLGAGTPTKGGEDIDFFFRLVVGGRTLVYEPSAVVWHRHRDTEDALVSQAVGYGRGFSAWATKTLLSPRSMARGLRTIARRGSVDMSPFTNYAAPLTASDDELPVSIDVMRVEHRSTLAGPPIYLWARATSHLGRARSVAADLQTRARRRRRR